EQAGRLPQAEGERADRHRVDEGDRPAEDAEVPEGDRHHRLLLPLGGEPLDEEARREHRLSGEADEGPDIQAEVAGETLEETVHRVAFPRESIVANSTRPLPWNSSRSAALMSM